MSPGRTGITQRRPSNAKADQRVRSKGASLDGETHGDRSGVPAGCGKAFEHRLAGSLVIEMKRLRIES